MNRSIVYVVMTGGLRGAFGVATTLREAAAKAKEAGAALKDATLAYQYISDDQDLSRPGVVTVNGLGDIEYPSDARSVRLWGPSDANVTIRALVKGAVS